MNQEMGFWGYESRSHGDDERRNFQEDHGLGASAVTYANLQTEALNQ
jgi:hypothetical protein